MRATANVIHEKRLTTVAGIEHETNFKYLYTDIKLRYYVTHPHTHQHDECTYMQMLISIHFADVLVIWPRHRP